MRAACHARLYYGLVLVGSAGVVGSVRGCWAAGGDGRLRVFGWLKTPSDSQGRHHGNRYSRRACASCCLQRREQASCFQQRGWTSCCFQIRGPHHVLPSRLGTHSLPPVASLVSRPSRGRSLSSVAPRTPPPEPIAPSMRTVPRGRPLHINLLKLTHSYKVLQTITPINPAVAVVRASAPPPPSTRAPP